MPEVPREYALEFDDEIGAFDDQLAEHGLDFHFKMSLKFMINGKAIHLRDQ